MTWKKAIQKVGKRYQLFSEYGINLVLSPFILLNPLWAMQKKTFTIRRLCSFSKSLVSEVFNGNLYSTVPLKTLYENNPKLKENIQQLKQMIDATERIVFLRAIPKIHQLVNSIG